MKKKVATILASLLALSLVFTGCSASPSSSGGGDSSAANSSSAASTASTANPVKGRDDQLIIGVDGDPHSWDPIATFLLSWSNVANSVFEGLVNRDNDLKINPGLATSWDYLNDKTLQFKLRKGVKFQNGEDFNADAVVFTFDRLLGPEGKKGPQQSNYTSIDHVEKVDDYTVNFILKTKDPVLITKLAGYGAVIVPPKYIKEKGQQYFAEHPIGTGPYKMTSYKKDSQVDLEKFDGYWQADKPKINKVVFRIIPESSTRLADFQTGAIDIMKNVEISQTETVKGLSYATLQNVASPTVYSLKFDVSQKPMDNVKVRQAVNYAVDKEALIQQVLNGYGKEISTFQSTLSFGNNESLKPYSYDPEKAKQLLKEAGVGSDTSLDMYIGGSNATFKEIAQAVAAYLEQVGLKVNIKTVDSSTLTSDLVPHNKAGHMYYQGWGGWTLDFDNTAYLLYHKGELWNPSFTDAKVDELMNAERSTVDQDERKAIFKDLTERLYELAPELNLYQSEAIYAVNNRVQGFNAPHDDRINLADVALVK